MTEAQPLPEALTLAYRYLDRRERTIAQTRRHLERAGIGATEIDDAVETLIDAGYLDDARFARVFAEDKRSLEQWGSDRIRCALLALGLDPDVTAATLAGEASESELDRALTLLSRRCPEPAQDRRSRDRALGILVRKGYDLDLALEALRVHNAGVDGASYGRAE